MGIIGSCHGIWNSRMRDKRNTCTSNCIRAASRSGKDVGREKCRRRGSDRDICVSECKR